MNDTSDPPPRERLWARFWLLTLLMLAWSFACWRFVARP
jgi:hypothetical protein